MKSFATISLWSTCAVAVLVTGASAAPSRDHAGIGISAAAAGPFPPTLPDIQANVFTPSCAVSFCHGAGMSANLDLRDGNSFSSLVNVPSLVSPGSTRVVPFDANGSFLVCKLEACSWLVGSQMPLIGGPLSQDKINVIRAWIGLGAPEFPSVGVEANTWGRVKTMYR
ncbi:MAG: hypothetical protein ACT4PE_08365 [Candidatus Eiseniibacteriota bacterium]